VLIFAKIVIVMGEITLQQALVGFKTIYLPARNLAARTREEYSIDLKAFIDFWKWQGLQKQGSSNLNNPK
jgi:hypothetical protein